MALGAGGCYGPGGRWLLWSWGQVVVMVLGAGGCYGQGSVLLFSLYGIHYDIVAFRT